MSNIIAFVLCFLLLPLLLLGLLGLLLGWLFFRGKKVEGDLSGAAVTAAPAAAAASSNEASDDDTYALEWRNRYLAARVKYLESQVAEAPKPVAKKAPAKVKAA